MDEEEVRRYWDENAQVWTELTRAGYDLYRDFLNTPAFLENLPDVTGQYGLDIGCGEGHNTRLLARRGARLEAIDISDVFIREAVRTEEKEPLHIRYQVASASSLPFEDATFDFATAFMSLMDIPAPERALQEAYRVLKPGGFLQFSISHPCFSTPHLRNLRGADGKTYAKEVGGYFDKRDGEVEEWIFGAAPPALKERFPKFKVPRFYRTLSQWVHAIVDAAFVLESLDEPKPDDELVRKEPSLQDAQVVAYFLHFRCRKL